jgi:general secretion pathway protein A
VALTPLSRDEVDAYIRHRISVAGGAEKVAFQLEAIRLVAELSRGLPRRVNVLCDRTLQEGRVDSARVVTVDHVKRAARSLSGQAPAPGAAEGPGRSIAGVPLSLGLDRRERRGWWKWITGGAVVAALAGGAGYASWANGALADSSMPEVTGPRRLQGPAPIAVPSEIELADFLAGR